MRVTEISEIAVGCSSRPAKVIAACAVTVVACMTFPVEAMSRHKLGVWALPHGLHNKGIHT